jgi:hypothetical protein
MKSVMLVATHGYAPSEILIMNVFCFQIQGFGMYREPHIHGT